MRKHSTEHLGATGRESATATRDPLVAPIPPNDACCPPSLQTDHPIRTTCQTTCQQTRRCEKVISSPRGYGDPGLHVFNGGRASMESCMDGERSSSRAMGRSTWSMQVAQHHRPGQESASGSDSSKPHERAMVQSRRVGYRPPRCKVHLPDDERLALRVGVGGVVPSPRLWHYLHTGKTKSVGGALRAAVFHSVHLHSELAHRVQAHLPLAEVTSGVCRC